jgi:superfamily II DNA/RNA helicase
MEAQPVCEAWMIRKEKSADSDMFPKGAIIGNATGVGKTASFLVTMVMLNKSRPEKITVILLNCPLAVVPK